MVKNHHNLVGIEMVKAIKKNNLLINSVLSLFSSFLFAIICWGDLIGSCKNSAAHPGFSVYDCNSRGPTFGGW